MTALPEAGNFHVSIVISAFVMKYERGSHILRALRRAALIQVDDERFDARQIRELLRIAQLIRSPARRSGDRRRPERLRRSRRLGSRRRLG
jgi:hypothetical protein